MNNHIPENINTSILNSIHEKLNPPYHLILLKLFTVHLGVAILTLSLCPQLGVKAFNLNINLMHSFMAFGKTYCDIFCGMFFTSTSMLVASLILSYDEKNVVRSKKIVSALSLLLFSIGGLIIFNPSLFVELSLVWILGALIGSITGIEIGHFSRKIFIISK